MSTVLAKKVEKEEDKYRNSVTRQKREIVIREQKVPLTVIQDAKAPLDAYSRQLTPAEVTNLNYLSSSLDPSNSMHSKRIG